MSNQQFVKKWLEDLRWTKSAVVFRPSLPTGGSFDAGAATEAGRRRKGHRGNPSSSFHQGNAENYPPWK